MTSTKKKPGEVRYQKILQTALPIFGKKGFAATTTRELSHAAGVSDALIYKYFPSKAAIYKALIDFCTQRGEDAAERLKELTPSTESFVKSIYFLFYMVIIGAPGVKKFKANLDKLLLQSLAGDGTFSRGFHDSKIAPWIDPILEIGFLAASDSGDLVSSDDTPANRIWFAYFVAFNYLIMQVPSTHSMELEGPPEEIFNETVTFALRGIGMKQEAIDRYFKPDQLRKFVDKMLI